MDISESIKDPPKRFVVTSLLDLVSKEVLEHLVVGFREKLKAGVTLYCRTKTGELVRIDPEGDSPTGRQKYWANVCNPVLFLERWPTSQAPDDQVA